MARWTDRLPDLKIYFKSSAKVFFCSIALTSTGWVQSTIKLFGTVLAVDYHRRAVIRTRAGWVWSTNATSVLCRPPFSQGGLFLGEGLKVMTKVPNFNFLYHFIFMDPVSVPRSNQPVGSCQIKNRDILAQNKFLVVSWSSKFN